MGKKRYQGKRFKESSKLPFHSGNYILFTIGIIIIVIGFVALSHGPWDSSSSLTIAPILLVVAYLVIVPLAIMYKKKNSQREGQPNESK